MAISFPENDIRTFRRSSFSGTQLQRYLSMHFKRMDLLSKIKGHYTVIMDSYLHSGNWFMQIGFPKESIKSYLEFFEYYKLHENELLASERETYIEMRNYAHSILAENYAQLGLLDSAAIQHKINMNFTKELGYIYHPSAINNYGLLLYWHKRELDSALSQFRRAYQIMEYEFPNHTLIGSIRDNMADIYVEQNHYEKAQRLYASNFEFYKHAINEKSLSKDIPRLISSGAQLVVANIHLNKLEEARKAFGGLDSIVASYPSKNTINAESRLEFLQAKEALLQKENNINAAYTTAKFIKKYADSIQKVTSNADRKWQEELNNITIDRIALNFKIDRLQKENKIKNQRTKLWIIGLVSSVFIILLLFFVFSRRQHLIHLKNQQLLTEKQLENSALKVVQLNFEIKSKERDLTDFAINLTQNQEWAKHIANRLKKIKYANPKDSNVLIEALDQDIANKISFDSNTQEFFERLDKLSNAFYSKLTNRYPNLSKNEIRLCSLIRLKIKSHSIATLQNITIASLNTSRYRLRKKLDLPENINLDFFIQNL
ncbi:MULTISPECIES: tetratricopeptide repeat protein [Arenibacter]|uniref:tetratricopeptide repeat protein n=1 Tax=Arenibacter TaxID=178469 RepID=UPI0012FFF8D6|nr:MULTISPECIES: tetratricopeptide repeat protein [Arenibacter]